MIKINTGSAMFMQFLLLLIFLPFILVFSYFVFENFSLNVVSFAIPIYIIFAFILKNSFSYYDLYIDGENVILKRLFFKSIKPKNVIKAVEKGILPITFSISFYDGSEFYFQMLFSDIYKGTDDTLEKIKNELSYFKNNLNQDQ